MYQPNPPIRAPRPLTLRGPKILTFSGITVLVVGLIAIAGAIVMLVGALPTNVMTRSGAPGPDAVASSAIGSVMAVETKTGQTYLELWEVQPAQADVKANSSAGSTRDGFMLRSSAVTVLTPQGESLSVSGSQSGGSLRIGDFEAKAFASFWAESPGTYEITFDPPAGYLAPTSIAGGSHPSDVIVAESSGTASFFLGIFGSIGLVFIGIGGLVLGILLTIPGIIWWVTRRKRIAQDSPSGPTPPYRSSPPSGAWPQTHG